MKRFYKTETEELMQLHYSRLPEKERRHYAAIEAEKLGHGGKEYIVKLFKMSTKTLYKGIAELRNKELYAQIPVGRQRRPGGGRHFFLTNPTKSLI